MSFAGAAAFPKKGQGGFLAQKVAENALAYGMTSMNSTMPSTPSVRDSARVMALYDASRLYAAPAGAMAGQQQAVQRLTDRLNDRQYKVQGGLYTGWQGKDFNFEGGGVFYKPKSGLSGQAGSRGSGLYGMQSGFSSMLTEFVAAARKAGYNITVGSGGNAWRSYDQQVALKKAKPGLAATPGASNHGWGLANDISFGSGAARAWAHANAARFGLRFPMSYEPWHIEPTRIAAK